MQRNFRDPSEGLHGMYNIWSFSELGAVVCSGLGGGFLIYATVLIRKPEKWFVKEDLDDGGFEYWPVTRAKLDPHYDRVEKMLGARPLRRRRFSDAWAGGPESQPDDRCPRRPLRRSDHRSQRARRMFDDNQLKKGSPILVAHQQRPSSQWISWTRAPTTRTGSSSIGTSTSSPPGSGAAVAESDQTIEQGSGLPDTRRRLETIPVLSGSFRSRRTVPEQVLKDLIE